MIAFIDGHTAVQGVEPICRTLQIAPSTHHAARVRPPSARHVRDASVSLDIGRVHNASHAVHGARRLCHGLRRGGADIGRDQPGGRCTRSGSRERAAGRRGAPWSRRSSRRGPLP